MDSFSNYNPMVNFIYFTAVIVFSMFFMHPIFQIIAIINALAYSILLKGRKAVRFSLIYMLPLLIFMAIINPLFNHAGTTILFYFKNGNPFTLESGVYGISATIMFVTVILWFSCYNEIITSDKIMYIFGNIIPSLSLIFSMVLRFVPRYIEQIKIISNSQKAIGRDMSQGNIIQRAKNGLKILSIMITWALENSIETADSMRARGYGLPGRTSFSIFKFDKRDKIVLVNSLILISIVVFGAFKGENTIRFFPSIKIKEITFFSLLIYISYFLLCILPIIINIQEAIKWKSIESKI